MASEPVPATASFRSRVLTWGVLLAGIIGGQCVVFWPSLTGQRLLAPTDLLTSPGQLNVAGLAGAVTVQHVLMDPVQVFYPWLDFAAREVRAGHLPTWNPYAYCGSPFLANMQSAVFSPFTAIYYLWPDPRALAWIQLAKALVAGIGAFGFLRVVGVRRWPSLVGGWCYPLAGYLMIWLNYPLSAAAVWLPAGMWSVAAVLRRPRGWGGPALAALVGLMLLSGHLETTAHVLLAMGLYGLGSWLAQSQGRFWKPEARRVVGATTLALIVGLLLGAAQVWPTLDYVGSSHRLQNRQRLQTERDYAHQTTGWEVIRLAFPLLGGTEQAGSRPLTTTGLHESGASGFVGVTMLLLVPIGLASGRRRWETWLGLGLAFWFAAPMFRIPGLRFWDHLPPFHLASNSRALMVTGWCVLVLGVRGLDSLGDRRVGRPWSVLVALGLAALLLVPLLAAWLEPLVFRRAIPASSWPWFRDHLIQAVVVTGLGLVCLLVWLLFPRGRRWAQMALGLVACGELLATAHGLNPQVERATYYPESPLCRFLSERVGDGRICGLWGALPPNLAMSYRLRDVRGYDAVDPDPFVELLLALPGQFGPTHALTWQLATGPSPVLDLLGVRYFLTPMPRAEFGAAVGNVNNTFIYENSNAMPRTFVPRLAVLEPSAAARLRRLSDRAFDPRAEVLVSAAARLPEGDMSGSAAILSESAGQVVVTADCATAAVVVLADSWASGWTVTVDGRAAEVLQADHALRAVLVSPGPHRIVWNYRPKAVFGGLACSACGLVGLAAWAIRQFRRRPQAHDVA